MYPVHLCQDTVMNEIDHDSGYVLIKKKFEAKRSLTNLTNDQSLVFDEL